MISLWQVLHPKQSFLYHVMTTGGGQKLVGNSLVLLLQFSKLQWQGSHVVMGVIDALECLLLHNDLATM